MCLQKSIPLFIVIKTFLMLTTIKFNHYFLLNAGEIGNVLSNRVLAAKTVAVKLFSP